LLHYRFSDELPHWRREVQQGQTQVSIGATTGYSRSQVN
jgi:hypothetical protein